MIRKGVYIGRTGTGIAWALMTVDAQFQIKNEFPLNFEDHPSKESASNRLIEIISNNNVTVLRAYDVEDLSDVMERSDRVFVRISISYGKKAFDTVIAKVGRSLQCANYFNDILPLLKKRMKPLSLDVVLRKYHDLNEFPSQHYFGTMTILKSGPKHLVEYIRANRRVDEISCVKNLCISGAIEHNGWIRRINNYFHERNIRNHTAAWRAARTLLLIYKRIGVPRELMDLIARRVYDSRGDIETWSNLPLKKNGQVQ